MFSLTPFLCLVSRSKLLFLHLDPSTYSCSTFPACPLRFGRFTYYLTYKDLSIIIYYVFRYRVVVVSHFCTSIPFKCFSFTVHKHYRTLIHQRLEWLNCCCFFWFTIHKHYRTVIASGLLITYMVRCRDNIVSCYIWWYITLQPNAVLWWNASYTCTHA